MAQKQELLQKYEAIFVKEEKKLFISLHFLLIILRFDDKIMALSGIEQFYSSTFSLKLMGIFEINFDILNVTKNYILGVEGKRFLINFAKMKDEILEFNNYLLDLKGLTEKNSIEIFLCSEKE